MVFAIPRDKKTYVGTTDTFYDQDAINPKMTASDRIYILNAIHYMFPDVRINEDDIESSWAGVRPLIFEEGKNPSEISRKDEIWESPSGLITIAGGKLTGYRKMAETVVNLLAEKFILEESREFSACRTKNLPISGGDVGGSDQLERYIAEKTFKGVEAGLSKEEAQHLAGFYGSNIDTVFELFEKNKADAAKYQMPFDLFAKLIYAIDQEIIATPLDFFYRRIGALLFNIESVRRWKNQVINYMMDQFNWTDLDKEQYSLELDEALRDAVLPCDEQVPDSREDNEIEADS